MIRRHRRPSLELLEGRTLMSYGGSPDVAFGNAGHFPISFGSGTTNISASAVSPDGKTDLVGTLFTGNVSTGSSSVYVARLNSDGSPDRSFGTNGVENLFTNSASMITSATSIAIQPNGNIVLGLVQGGKAEIARLSASGTFDASFGTLGIAALTGIPGSASGSNIGIVGVAVAPNGKILASATEFDQSIEASHFDLVQLNADGSIDTSFGSQGIVSTKFITTQLNDFPTGTSGLLIQANGKIDFTGTILPPMSTTSGSIYIQINSGAAILQLNTDGTPDTAFGPAGYSVIPTSFAGVKNAEEIATSLVQQPDGKLILAGYLAINETSNNQFFAARINTDGTTDTTFGVGGIAPVGYQGPTYASSVIATTAAVTSDGKILIGGSAFHSGAIARLTSTGQPDPTFGQGGETLEIVPGTDVGFPVGISIRSDGVILATTSNGYLLGLRNTGAANDYNDDGISDPAVYLPNQAVFAYRPSSGAPDVTVPFGSPLVGQTIPAPGYYDNSGRSEIGVYLASQGSFAYRPAGGGADVILPFGVGGVGGTIPAVGYYDGTGHQDIAAYLPSLGVYAIRPFDTLNQGVHDELIPFGIAGAGQSIPVPGHYEGGGIDDIAVYLPSLGAYAIRPSSGGPDKIIPFGVAGMGQSIPMPGDYDGSGKTELAVYIPSQGVFAYRPANGGADVVVQFGIAGAGQTLPAAGDYTGSGHTELGVYLPSLGLYAYRPGFPAGATLPDVVEPFGPGGQGQTIPFNGIPAADTLPTTIAAASVETPLVADAIEPTVLRKPKVSPTLG